MNPLTEVIPAPSVVPGHGAAHPLIEFLAHDQTTLAGQLKSFNSLIDAGEPLDTIGRAARGLLPDQARYVALRANLLFPPLERALGQELSFVNSFLDMWRSQTTLLEEVARRAAREDRAWSTRRGKKSIGLARDLMWKEAHILFPVLERAFSQRTEAEIVESMVRPVLRDAARRAQPPAIP
jgi:hypothetical protein